MTYDPFDPNCRRVKVYRESGDFVATFIYPQAHHRSAVHAKASEEENALREAYYEGLGQGLRGEALVDHMEAIFPNRLVTTEDIRSFIKKEANRLHKRVKHYKRKINMMEPNYFVTFTYADELQDADSFERRLRRVLSNLSSRRGWRYACAREYGENGQRKHFHALVYVPEGQMIGELCEETVYSKKRHRHVTRTVNTWFGKRFGTATFEAITDAASISDYLLKYIIKSGEHLIYGRGVPAEIEAVIDLAHDVVDTVYDHTVKLILDARLFGKRLAEWAFCHPKHPVLEGGGYDASIVYTALA